jgi:hypothetical protein
MEQSGLTGIAGQPKDSSAQLAMAQIEAQFKRGAGWFYWLAGLSLINAAIDFFKGDWTFLFGLGITKLVGAFASEGGADPVVTLVTNLLLIAVFVAFGAMALKKSKPMYVVGIIVYGLDLLLCLLLQIWLFAAFHAWVMWQLVSGYRACSQLLEMERQVAPGLSAVKTD